MYKSYSALQPALAAATAHSTHELWSSSSLSWDVMDDVVACCSVSISGASLSCKKVSAASGVACCHVSNTGGSLSCDSVWVTSVVEFCCILTSGGHLSCINVRVSLSFAPSTVAGCSSVGVAFLLRVVVVTLAVVAST
jgi:hypothetical protein